MSDSTNNAGKIITGALVLGSLALGGYSIYTLSRPAQVPPQGAVHTMVREEVVRREVVVPMVQLDYDGVADMVAKKVEQQVAEKVQARMAQMAPVAAPAQVEVAPSPVPVEAPVAAAAPVREVKTEVPEAPPLGPVPAGSFNTKLGAMPAVGGDDALVYVYVLSDFQCPVCKRAAEGLAPMLRQYGSEVRWVFWNNPLDMHSRARAAAKAGMAAFRQGKFWEYHDLMFENNRSFQDQDFEAHAQALGLDLAKFRQDMQDPAMDFMFNGTSRVAKLLDAQGTPAFVINGRKQVGWGSAGGIQSMVDRELDAMKALVAQGKSLDEARNERAKANSESDDSFQVYQKYMVAGEVPPQEVQ